MAPICQNVNMRWRKRRGTLDKTSGKTSAGTPSTSLAVKTSSKKKKVHKIQGKWLITPVNRAPLISGENAATTLATILSKKTHAKYSTTTAVKMPSKSRTIPSRSHRISFVNNGAKTFLKRSVFKVTSSSNLEVKETSSGKARGRCYTACCILLMLTVDVDC